MKHIIYETQCTQYKHKIQVDKDTTTKFRTNIYKTKLAI